MKTEPVVPIRGPRMKKAEIGQLEAQIFNALQSDNPQSVRHLFYLMTNPRLPVSVPKKDKGKNNGYNKIQSRMAIMRRQGRLPYSWVTDTTRRGYHVDTYVDGSDFIRSMSRHYRFDMWRSISTHVEVWCESRSIAGVIQADCEDYAVSLYPAGGFSSISFVYEAASYIQDAIKYSGKDSVCVLYIGDYDPAGVLVDQSIEKEMKGHLPGVPLEFRRVGINAEQVEDYDLPTKPRKSGDNRALHITETVEAEAMPAHLLRQLLRDELESFIPERELRAVRVAETSERDGLRALAENYLPSQISGGQYEQHI